MSVDITSPMDPDEEVTLLPTHQNPYGDNCPLDRRHQSILFHYDVNEATVAVLAQAQIFTLKQIKFMNPDAADGSDEKSLYNAIVVAQVQDRLQQYLVTNAFRRMLRPAPLAAIIRAPSGASSSRAASLPAPVDPGYVILNLNDALVQGPPNVPQGFVEPQVAVLGGLRNN